MIIKTITCHHVYNHGALLQAYALTEFLKGEGHDVSIIDYRPPYLDGHFRLWRSDPRYNRLGLGWAYVLAKLPGRIRALKRKKAFDVFFDHYIPVTERIYHSVEELQACPPEADLYIAGSDQIWNTSFPNGKDPSFYLDFGNAKKISYAASFATESIADGWVNFVKKQLSNFNSITVRESSALDLLECLGYSGKEVMDPVFLLNTEQWQKIYNGTGENEDFILAYDYVKNKSSIGYVAKRLAKIFNCKIYSIGPYKLSYADKSFVDCGPDSFLSLIKNAKIIVSNSFHASAFSMIFNKDFFVVNRDDGLNIRMKDLLCKYGIQERLITKNVSDEILEKDICYNNLNDILVKDINGSKQIIKDLLNV